LGWQDLKGYFDFQDVYAGWASTAPKGATFVEVGVYFGKSLAYMAERLEARPDVSVYAVDHFAGETLTGLNTWVDEDVKAVSGPFTAFTSQMLLHAPKALERARVLRCNSAMAARLFEDKSVEMVFIDADHSYESVLADIRAWLPKMKSGALLAGHDHMSAWPGVERAAREVFGSAYEVQGTSWLHRVDR
jgi:predicted O-methyltransferase YrrM